MAAATAGAVPNGLPVSGNAEHRSRPSPQSLTNLSEVLASLADIQAEETELAGSLSTLLSSQEPITQSLDRLNALTPQIDELEIDASLLSTKVSTTAKTAERVGGRVRQLDEEMRRVREASEWVSQVMELKVSPAGFS